MVVHTAVGLDRAAGPPQHAAVNQAARARNPTADVQEQLTRVEGKIDDLYQLMLERAQ